MLTLTTFGSPQIGSAMLPAGRRLVAAAVTLVVTGGLSTVAALPASAAASTMHYSPGAPIPRSFDLVNWEFAGHSVPVLDFGSNTYNLSGGRASPDQATPLPRQSGTSTVRPTKANTRPR